MGFDATCAISHLPIPWDSPVVLLYLYEPDIPREEGDLRALPLYIRGKAGEWADLEEITKSELARVLPVFHHLPITIIHRSYNNQIKGTTTANEAKSTDDLSSISWAYVTEHLHGQYIDPIPGKTIDPTNGKSYVTWHEYKPHYLQPVLVHAHIFDAIVNDKYTDTLTKQDLVHAGNNLLQLRQEYQKWLTYDEITRNIINPFRTNESIFGHFHNYSHLITAWATNLAKSNLTNEQLALFADEAKKVDKISLALGWANRKWRIPARGPQQGNTKAHSVFHKAASKQLTLLQKHYKL